jgi:formylglycine-generating enzyme required for sulfatase activity
MTAAAFRQGQAGDARLKNMVWVPGGSFLMGSDDFYPEESPVREASVAGFWIDEHSVTVAEFRRFVKATGWATTAEQAPSAAEFPDADPEMLVPGSLVFVPTSGPVDLHDFRNWWDWIPGACWRHPEGPRSTLNGRDRHPVTQVSFDDALAYATWAGKELPSETEWEWAARGGLEGAVYSWGNEFAPGGRAMANTWQGQFPWQNFLTDGYERTSPIKTFPPNGFGLYDMTGNVWEWTSDCYAAPGVTGGAVAPRSSCCGPLSRHEPARDPQADRVSSGPLPAPPRRVIKGGSHLCSPNYCMRYRPAARQEESPDTSTSHIGFRCIIRPPVVP